MTRHIVRFVLTATLCIGVHTAAEPNGARTSNVVVASRIVTGPGTVHLYTGRLQGSTCPDRRCMQVEGFGRTERRR